MKILFVGDVMLGRLANEVLKKSPPEYAWGNTLPIFRVVDFRMCNLECVISDKGSPVPKIFNFQSDAKNVEVLKTADIDAVSLGNNHSLDYGEEAMLDMQKILDKNNIRHAGAGKDLDEASQMMLIKIGNKRIGVLSFTDNEPLWEAAKNRPGIYYVPIDLEDNKAKLLLQKIEDARNKFDLIIAAIHWGPNWGYLPPPNHIPFAHALIDAGVDVIFGHSGHVFRGIETYKNRPIIYCAGNFVDDYAIDPVERNDQSFIFILDIGNGKSSMTLHPTVIKNFQAQLAHGEQAGEIAEKMKSLCAEMGTSAQWLPEENHLKIEI